MHSANLPVVHKIAHTINQLVDNSCLVYKDLPVIGMALEEPLTYAVFYEHILSLAAQLREYGVGHGDRVALLGENSHHWAIAYLAIVRLGAVAVPILPDLPEADVHHILTEMECEVVFLTQRQSDKIYEIRKKVATLITLDDSVDEAGVLTVTPFSEVLDSARSRFLDDIAAGRLVFSEVDSQDLASILYTSGTSGFSKAVMLSHANLCANAESVAKIIDIPPGSVFLSVLPIAHTYEFTVGFLMPLLKGYRVVYAGKTPTPAVLQKICAKERPHGILVVPLIMEKIYKKRVLPAIEKSAMLTMLCRVGLGRRFVYRQIGRKLEAFFGGRLLIMGIGGAALNPEVEEFLRLARFPFLVGYGMTESSPLISGGPYGDTTIELGSAGKPVPGVKVRIAESDTGSDIGEIQVQGDNVMQGYWNDPEATNETFTEDGWLKTGDLGFIDGLGNVHVCGRSKSVIVLANGENVYPEAIEHKLNTYPMLVESLVLENRGKLEAWVYPDYDFIDEMTEGGSREQRHRYITEQLDEIRNEINAQLSTASRLSRIIERREPFIKTATHKIKRYLYTVDLVSPHNE